VKIFLESRGEWGYTVDIERSVINMLPIADFEKRFRALLEEQKLEIANCLMIGNDRETDIAGAKAAGLDTLYMHTELTPPHQKDADPALLPGAAPAGTRHFEFEGDDWTVLAPLICQLG
jgi:predicted HAD superfamily hydrolase